MNTYPEFQVKIFSDKRDITKYQSFCKSKNGHNSEKIRAITEPDHTPHQHIVKEQVWSQNGEWFSKGSSGQNCIHGQTNGWTDRHVNCICAQRL